MGREFHRRSAAIEKVLCRVLISILLWLMSPLAEPPQQIIVHVKIDSEEDGPAGNLVPDHLGL